MNQRFGRATAVRNQKSSSISKALRMTLALLLALSLVPATTLFAYADELEVLEQEAVEQEALELEADEQALSDEDIDLSLDAEVIQPEDEPAGIEPENEEDAVIEPAQTASREIEAAGLIENSSPIDLLSTPAKIVIEVKESGSVKVGNLWSSNIIVSRNGGAGTTVSAQQSTTLTVAQGNTIEITESRADTTFRHWAPLDSPLVSGSKCIIRSIPKMSAFTSDSAGTIAGHRFFSRFNQGGSLTSLPAGSFDTSSITTVEFGFFSEFNERGSLTSLPTRSFNISKITTAGDSFFFRFNHQGSLTALPAGSFNTSNITTAGNNFFSWFNHHGSLTSLSAGSFSISKITTAGDAFFSCFNYQGPLTSLPAGSFNTSNITTAGNGFFSWFNREGSLTSLPVGSFNTSKIATARNEFFSNFNLRGSLTSLPTGSFNTSNITTVGNSFFSWFNREGSITALPAGAFNTSKITIAREYFFSYFNSHGSLIALPAGSFNISKITTAGDSFFSSFNSSGSLASLPAGSFDTSMITIAGNQFLSDFSAYSSLAILPLSFKLPQTLTSVGSKYCEGMFDNSALTRGNQAARLYFARASTNTFKGTSITPVSPGAGATVYVNGSDYSVSYSANGGTGSVASQGVIQGAGFTTRANAYTRTGYTFSGWNTAANGSGRAFAANASSTFNFTTSPIFYAQWKPNANTAYKVEHYKVSSTGKVTLAATQNLKGTTAAKVTAQARSFTGFTQDTKHSQRVATGTINANGTLTLKLYYKVNSYTITYVPNGASGSSVKQTVYYGESYKVRAASTFKRPGQSFQSWNTLANGSGTTFSAGSTKTYNTAANTILRAQWKQTGTIALSYQTHVQSVGWQAVKTEGNMSGTSGRALRLEGIKLNLENTTGIPGGISYATHVQSIGWQKKVSLSSRGNNKTAVQGPISGTSGRGLRLEAITIELTGDLKKHYDIYYRVHAQSVGWMGWARNGQEAGTAGHAYRLEGIQIVLVPKVGGKKPGNTFKGITTPAGTRAYIKR